MSTVVFRAQASTNGAAVLHANEHALYRAVPEAPTAVDVANAWCRLAAEVVATDGTPWGSLLDAIGALVGAGARVEWHATPPNDPGDAVVWRVPGQWTVGRACGVATGSPYEGASWILVAQCPLPPPDRLWAAASLLWVRLTDCVLVALAKERLKDSYATTLYLNGVLWAEEPQLRTTEADLAGMRLHVSVLSVNGTVGSRGHDVIPEFPERGLEEGCIQFARTFLRARHAVTWSASACARALFRAAHPWRFSLRTQWRAATTQEELDAVRDEAVCEELTALQCPDVLLRCAASHPRVDMMGLSILRRMQPECVRTADWLASAGVERAVSHFATLPVSAARLATLFRVGVVREAGWDAVCEAGVLRGVDDKRIVFVPKDATVAILTRAITTLLDANARRSVGEAHMYLHPHALYDEDGVPEMLVLDYDHVHTEGATDLAPDATVVAYRVAVDSGAGLQLTLDPLVAPRSIQGAHAVDVVASSLVPTIDLDVVGRTRRAMLATTFPRMASRLSAATEDGGGSAAEDAMLQACLMEARGRRLAYEWTVTGLDEGDNASSLGVSLAVALSLGAWAGARVRVFLDTSSCAACVGVWCGDDYLLIRPGQSTCNALTVASSLSTPSSQGAPLRRGMLVEVRARQNWQVARVVRVFDGLQTAVVEMLDAQKRTTISLATHTWRRLVKSENTNADRVLLRAWGRLPAPVTMQKWIVRPTLSTMGTKRTMPETPMTTCTAPCDMATPEPFLDLPMPFDPME